MLYAVLSALVTANLVAFTWIFFRATNLADSLLIIKQIAFNFEYHGIDALHPKMESSQFCLALLLIAFLFTCEAMGGKENLWKKVDAQPKWLRWSAHYFFVVALIVLILTNPGNRSQQFIYFQF
jgi:alginate O-acetyltransferase complex protein AlgI